MRAPWTFRSPLAEGIERFLAYKRALGRRFDTEEKQLRLFDRFLVQQALTDLAEITPDLVAEFLAARPRPRPRSYNQLLGVLRRLFDWLVTQVSATGGSSDSSRRLRPPLSVGRLD